MTPGRPRSRRRPCRVLVVAAAGYGKTASAEADLGDDGLRCSAAQVLALGAPVSRPLVVEDLHRVCVGERVEVLQRLAALADSVPVTITSREPLDRTSRGMLRGQVFERGPGDLALTGPRLPGSSPTSTASPTPRPRLGSMPSPAAGRRSCTSPPTPCPAGRVTTSPPP
jgi:hypothetical protein